MLKIIFLMYTLIVISMPVYPSENCSTNLISSDDYKKLGKILKCLNNRINELEKVVDKKSIINPYSELFFENDFLKVSLNAISISTDKKQIILSLIVLNSSKEEVYLSFDRSSNWPSLTGNKGTYLTSPKISGLPISHGTYLNKRSNYSRITAGKKTIVNLIFHSGEDIEADEFHFSSELARYTDKKHDTFSMGIQNLRL